jgi:hypothetical protein
MAADESWSARELFDLRGHTDDLTAILFGHDGARLYTGSADGTVRVWDAITGRELFTLASGKTAVAALSLSADGRRLAVASDAVRVYELPLDELLAHARSWSARDLTPGERVAYLRHDTPGATEVSAGQSPSDSPDREQMVKAFVAAWNRGDVRALRELFTDDLTYSLDITGFADYPVRADSLKGFGAFHSIGAGGRFKLVDCSPPEADAIECRLTYDNRVEARTSYPLHLEATFLFWGYKIREVRGALPQETASRMSDEGWTVINWTAANVPSLYERFMSIMRITTRDPVTRSEAEVAAAGRMLMLMSEIYKQRSSE